MRGTSQATRRAAAATAGASAPATFVVLAAPSCSAPLRVGFPRRFSRPREPSPFERSFLPSKPRAPRIGRARRLLSLSCSASRCPQTPCCLLACGRRGLCPLGGFYGPPGHAARQSFGSVPRAGFRPSRPAHSHAPFSRPGPPCPGRTRHSPRSWLGFSRRGRGQSFSRLGPIPCGRAHTPPRCGSLQPGGARRFFWPGHPGHGPWCGPPFRGGSPPQLRLGPVYRGLPQLFSWCCSLPLGGARHPL